MGEREWKLLLYTKWRCELDYHYKGRMELGLEKKKDNRKGIESRQMRATGRRQKEWFEQKRAGERGKREGEDEGRLSREEAHLCSLRFTCYPVFSPRSFPGTLALRRPGTSTTTTTTLWHRGRRGSSVPCFLFFYFPFFIFTLWSFLPSL